ncbi:Carbohydrate-Binding Module Family 13 protein [Glomus cerebriforme]|uniref:Carbohydrate-Binding Module Family 13 protein n=1 Tax=Glomus cerebriforme TaxID=658196 RepID=A0A397T0K3_9GLOM|nr:Carbohydrate-Binding Module Family 13 protein [Glomus cerebriforme]
MRSLFFIEAKHSGKVFDVATGSRENGAKIIQYIKKSMDDPTVDNQLWYFNNGAIYNENSDLVIDVSDANIQNDTQIIQYENNPECSDNQRWTYNEHDKTISLKAHPNFVLDVKGSSQDDRAPIILYNKNVTPNQQFILRYINK